MSERIKHKVFARHSQVKAADWLSIPLIKRCILTALEAEGMDSPCEVSVLVTDERSIRGINHEFRGINAPTDVLSFPMQERSSYEHLTLDGWANLDENLDPETGLLPLGEIVLSAERVDKQAREYGHSKDYETAYLTVHSTLHLLGYNHVDEAEDKKRMRERERAIMEEIVVKYAVDGEI